MLRVPGSSVIEESGLSLALDFMLGLELGRKYGSSCVGEQFDHISSPEGSYWIISSVGGDERLLASTATVYHLTMS